MLFKLTKIIGMQLTLKKILLKYKCFNYFVYSYLVEKIIII